jgi:hypothetical protein
MKKSPFSATKVGSVKYGPYARKFAKYWLVMMRITQLNAANHLTEGASMVFDEKSL